MSSLDEILRAEAERDEANRRNQLTIERNAEILAENERLRGQVEFLSPFVEANDGLGQALVEARAEVERLRESVASTTAHYENARADANEARAAIARVRELCREAAAHPDGAAYPVIYVNAVLAALDGEAM